MINLTRNELYLEPIKLDEYVVNPIFYKTFALNALTGIFNSEILEYIIYGYLGLDENNRIVPSIFAKKLFEDAIKTLIEINFENAKKQFPFLENFTLDEIYKALFINEIRIVNIPSILQTNTHLIVPNTLLFADKITQILKNKAVIQSLPYGYITYKRLLQKAVELYFYNDVVKNYKYELQTVLNDMFGKNNYFKENIVSKTIDYSGRSVIVPDITLKLGEVRIPDVSYYWVFDEIYTKALLEQYDELLKDLILREKIKDFFKQNAHLVKNAYYDIYREELKRKAKIIELSSEIEKLREEISKIDEIIEEKEEQLLEVLKEEFKDNAVVIKNFLLSAKSESIYEGVLKNIKNKEMVNSIVKTIRELESKKLEKQKELEKLTRKIPKRKEGGGLKYEDIASNAIYKKLVERFKKFLENHNVEVIEPLKEFIVFERIFYRAEKTKATKTFLVSFKSAFSNPKIIKEVLIKYKKRLDEEYKVYLDKILNAKTEEEFKKVVQELEPILSYDDYITLTKGKKILYKGEKISYRKASEIRNELAKKFVKLIRHKLPAYALFVRQPTLWRHNLQAFKVYPCEDKAIKIFPLQTEGFDGDFDGDTYGYFTLHFEKSLENLTIENNLLDSFGNLVYKFKNEFLSAFANPKVRELIEIISLRLNDNEILRMYDEIIKKINKDRIISLLEKYKNKISNNFDIYLTYLIEVRTGEMFKQVLEDLRNIMISEDYNLLLELLERKQTVRYYIIENFEKFNEIFKYIVLKHKDKAIDILTMFLREIVKYAQFTFDISEMEKLLEKTSKIEEKDYFGNETYKNEIIRIIESNNVLKKEIDKILEEIYRKAERRLKAIDRLVSYCVEMRTRINKRISVIDRLIANYYRLIANYIKKYRETNDEKIRRRIEKMRKRILGAKRLIKYYSRKEKKFTKSLVFAEREKSFLEKFILAYKSKNVYDILFDNIFIEKFLSKKRKLEIPVRIKKGRKIKVKKDFKEEIPEVYRVVLELVKEFINNKDIPNQIELIEQMEKIEENKEKFSEAIINFDIPNVNAMNSKTTSDIFWQIVGNRGIFSNMKGELQFPIKSSLLYREIEDENGNIIRETKGLSSIEFFISAHNQRYALAGGKTNIGRSTNLGSYISYALRTLEVIDDNCNLDVLYCPYIKENKICKEHFKEFGNVNFTRIGLNLAHYYRRKLVNSLFKFKHKAGVLKSSYAKIITKKQYVDEVKQYLIKFYKPYEIKFYNEELKNDLVLVAKVLIKSKKGTIENWLSALENYILLQHNYPLKLVNTEENDKTIKELMEEYNVVVGKRINENTYAIIPDEIIKVGEELTIDGWTDYALLYRYVDKDKLKERHYNEIKELTSAFFNVDKTTDFCLRIISNLVIEKRGLKNAFIKGNINDDWFLLAFGEKYLPVISLEAVKDNMLNPEKVYRF
jgi:hypothetical protein